ncbi:hypothetical protein SADUNF_Sadunf04G0116300 [Salix dunnii]|uniref:Uncharacterized protein n=1 Tax=Salix dunnii TaxID=1413687 RepID=A0A835KBY1_9ROSI|nr:hypothetical protein SADUNF_Sadunf04G0116300 [Salix dunnii]
MCQASITVRCLVHNCRIGNLWPISTKFSICCQNPLTLLNLEVMTCLGTGIMMHPSNEAENLQSRVVTDDEVSVIDKEIQTGSNGFPINEEIGVSPSQLFQGDLSKTSLKHAFSPN